MDFDANQKEAACKSCEEDRRSDFFAIRSEMLKSWFWIWKMDLKARFEISLSHLRRDLKIFHKLYLWIISCNEFKNFNTSGYPIRNTCTHSLKTLSRVTVGWCHTMTSWWSCCLGFGLAESLARFASNMKKKSPYPSMVKLWRYFVSSRRIQGANATTDRLRPILENWIISQKGDTNLKGNLKQWDYFHWDCYANNLEAIQELKNEIKAALEVRLETIENALKNWVDRMGTRGGHLAGNVFINKWHKPTIQNPNQCSRFKIQSHIFVYSKL